MGKSVGAKLKGMRRSGSAALTAKKVRRERCVLVGRGFSADCDRERRRGAASKPIAASVRSRRGEPKSDVAWINVGATCVAPASSCTGSPML